MSSGDAVAIPAKERSVAESSVVADDGLCVKNKINTENNIIDTTKDHPIEKVVQEIWIECPGIGIKCLLDKIQVEKLLPNEMVQTLTKPRIKVAKDAIPYRYYDYGRSQEGLEEESLDIPTSQEEGAVTKPIPPPILKQAPQAEPPFPQEKVDFIQSKIQQRQSLRKEKRYEESDYICRGLEGMGVTLIDKYKIWTYDVNKATSQSIVEQEGGKVDNNNVEDKSYLDGGDTGISCEMCGRSFASRNLVFKHLRDPLSGCGNSIFAAGLALEDSPKEVERRERKEKNYRGRKERRAEQQQLDATIDAASCLWFGDLPLAWTRHKGNHKRLRAMLREYMPRDTIFPWIRKVVRKSYKDYQGSDPTSQLGYAILVFRDGQEATTIEQAMNGITVDPKEVFRDLLTTNKDREALSRLPTFTLKVQRDLKGSANEITCANDNENRLETNQEQQHKILSTVVDAGQDPSLLDQLRPLTMQQLKERISRWKSQNDMGDSISFGAGNNIEKKQEQLTNFELHEMYLNQLVQCYNIHYPRKSVDRQGRAIPNQLRDRLLEILRNLRWPAENERPTVLSDRYLVLRANNETSYKFFPELSDACKDLMQWADPNYSYSAIAVTKNFVSSPHIDDRDQSFQYAVSLGDFDSSTGGQLCVEGYSLKGDDDSREIHEEYLCAVNTHNRIARVDGRHIHWVRTWCGGDRYSLIYYDTREQNATPIIPTGVDEEYLH